jgi:hypothetical protein
MADANAHEELSLLAEETENAFRLWRDSWLYGVEFVDVLGRRIDPRTVSPMVDDYSHYFDTDSKRDQSSSS